DDDFGVDPGRVDVAEHFGDAADRAARGGRPPRQLDADHLARFGAAFLSRRDEDVHQHAAIERHDVTHALRAQFAAVAVVALVAADDPFVRALEDPDDPPFRPAAVLDALDAHDDAVTVHRFVEQRAGDVDVAARFDRPLRRDEAVAGRM